VRISNVTVTRNHDGLIALGGGNIISFGNKRINGNDFNNGPANSNIGQQ
jgi:hypothetical protein